MISVARDESVSDFLRHAGELLHRHEATNGLLLGICLSPTARTVAPHLFRILEHGRTVSAAVQTPSMNLVLTSATRPQLQALVDDMSGCELPGVVGPAEESTMFAGMWSAVTGTRAQLAMDQTIYRLTEVTFPAGADGEFRVAIESDLSAVVDWMASFERESLPPSSWKTETVCAAIAAKMIANRDVYLWTVDGAAVSMASVSRRTENGASINAVYTPLASRCRGYASVIVASLSQWVLDSGKKFCVLYADSANATANRIYLKIGFSKIAVSRHFLFL